MEKKRNSFIVVLLIIFLFPLSYLGFGQYMNFDTLSAIVFVLIIAFLIIKNRKKLDFQAMIKIGKIPLIYAVLWKTKFGLKFMDKVAEKFREVVKLIGYCFIGFGFFGMIFISVNIIIMLIQLFISPREASQGVALVLPLTNIPGVGYLSFWHFIIAVFFTVLIHEFAHGIMARAHNVPVKASGLGVFSIILPLFPLAFVEPEEKKLEKEKDIVQYSVFSAGPMINVCFAFLVLLLINFAVVPIEDKITHSVGFSFTDLMDNYSAQENGMEPGMIINNVNGVEVLTYQDFSEEIGTLKPGDNLSLGTLNSTFNIVTKPAPDDLNKGYIGILNIQNERRVNEGYNYLGGFFFWIKGLIKWLFFINLAIGLMNLLPLMVTDGGRMLKTAFEKIFRKKELADKLWLFIGIVFISTILIALLIKYSLSLLSLFGIA
jgi:membrane-associated protease RseP (regulator of RpoE activity)